MTKELPSAELDRIRSLCDIAGNIEALYDHIAWQAEEIDGLRIDNEHLQDEVDTLQNDVDEATDQVSELEIVLGAVDPGNAYFS